MRELLTSPEDTRLAVEFAAACGAITTLNPGAIAAQPKLHQVEELVRTRHGG
jgi:sugar/nucleoside kinase (ribokinase family)